MEGCGGIYKRNVYHDKPSVLPLPVVEELAASRSIDDRVLIVVHNIVRGDGGQGGGLGSEDAPLQLRQVIPVGGRNLNQLGENNSST